MDHVEPTNQDAEREDAGGGSLGSAIRLGVLVFVLLVAGLAIVAWLAGDVFLPMEYEGFD